MNLQLVKKIFNKYKIYILGGTLFLVLLILFLVFFVLKKEIDPKLLVLFDENKLIPIVENDKYGYMDTNGETIIRPEYLSAGEFYSNYAAVLISDNGIKKYKIIDRTGAEKMTIESDVTPKYYNDFGVWLIANKIYNTEMNIVFEGNYNVNYLDYGYFEFMNNERRESGIVNHKGKIIFKWDQDYISTKISTNEFKDDGYYALISNYEEEEKIINLKNGKELFSLEDPKNTYIREEDNNIFRVIDRSDSFKTKTWLYCKDGKIAYKSNESIYSMSLLVHDPSILEIDYGPSYENSDHQKQYVYYNVASGKTLEAKPNTIDRSLLEKKYGYYIVSKDGKQFGIEKNNKENLEQTYDEVRFLNEDVFNYLSYKNKEHLALLKKDSYTYLYNMRKKKVIETFESNSVVTSPTSLFLIVTLFETDGFTKKGHLVYNLDSHKSQEFSLNDEIKAGSNYFSVKTGDSITYYDLNMEPIHK